MRDPTPEFPKLLELFNIDAKRELEQHCARLTVHQTDLVALILGAQHGALHPYRYANFFDRRLPGHLIPNKEEREAVASNGVGPFKTKAASKFARKLFQLPKQQRALAAHLFYTPNYKYWYLFYFDNRDISVHSNHWKYGSHIHLVCSLWPQLSLSEVWKKATKGNLQFSNKIHIRFKPH
jgi:hypothetical protein